MKTCFRGALELGVESCRDPKGHLLFHVHLTKEATQAPFQASSGLASPVGGKHTARSRGRPLPSGGPAAGGPSAGRATRQPSTFPGSPPAAVVPSQRSAHPSPAPPLCCPSPQPILQGRPRGHSTDVPQVPTASQAQAHTRRPEQCVGLRVRTGRSPWSVTGLRAAGRRTGRQTRLKKRVVKGN